MIRNLLFLWKHKRACRELQRIVEANAKSPACVSYREHRAAALKARRA